MFEKLGSHKIRKENLKIFPFLDIKIFFWNITHHNVSNDILFNNGHRGSQNYPMVIFSGSSHKCMHKFRLW